MCFIQSQEFNKIKQKETTLSSSGNYSHQQIFEWEFGAKLWPNWTACASGWAWKSLICVLGSSTVSGVQVLGQNGNCKEDQNNQETDEKQPVQHPSNSQPISFVGAAVVAAGVVAVSVNSNRVAAVVHVVWHAHLELPVRRSRGLDAAHLAHTVYQLKSDVSVTYPSELSGILWCCSSQATDDNAKHCFGFSKAGFLFG